MTCRQAWEALCAATQHRFEQQAKARAIDGRTELGQAARRALVYAQHDERGARAAFAAALDVFDSRR